ncbi:MAG: cadherin-like beta sandwich domain-containing protein, partial [Verrucomicrobiota bacterium]
LMATCMLNNLLALDSLTERATDLQVYLTTGSSRQASLNYDYRNFSKPGDIWPESLQYSSAVSTIRTFHMALLERYDSTLNLFGVYTNLPTSLPRIAQLCYPNTAMQISFGDGHRDDGTGQPYPTYEMAYQHAWLRGRTNLTSLFGGLLNGGINAGKYTRSSLSDYDRLGTHTEPLKLLWAAPAISEPGVALTYPRSDQLPWAGIALQRNPSTVNNSTFGLMGFVGGAAHVHSHASGMSMELFGLGQVMGAKAGRDAYGSTIHEKYYRLFSANNTVVVNAASSGSGGWSGLGINTVQTVAMEPQPFAAAVSSNFSFTCSSFVDDKGTLAEATQQRTLSIIRTSPTNGFYVDFFRSRSTVNNRVATTLNGNVTNQFHDYIYRNIGSTNISITTNGVALGLVSQPNRFQNDIGDTYDQPGWRYFTNTVVSYPHSQSTRVQFNATPSTTTLYMDMIVPAITNREYARVASPPIVDYNSTAPGPTVVIRQIGDAWDKPFAVVYEPHYSASGSTITNVTALWRSNSVVGLKIESVVGGQNRVHYVLSNPNATDTYTDSAIGLSFKGRFAIATDNGDGTGSLYLGSGSSLQFNGYLMASVSGANTQAQLTFATGQPPVVTANSAVTVTSPGATLSSLVTSVGVLTPAFSSSIFSYSVGVTLEVTNISVTPTTAFADATVRVNGNLVTSGTPSSPIGLNPGVNLINTVVVAPDASSTNTYTLTVNRNSYKAWDANSTAAGAGATPTGTWGASSFWNSDLTGGGAGAFTSATFNSDDLFLVASPSGTSGSNAYSVTVTGSQFANSLNFQSAGAPTLSGGTSITLGDGSDGSGGITVPQYAYGTTAQGNPTISTPVILNNSQSWFVDTARTLTVNGEVSGSGTSLTKLGAGILRLNAASTHDGDTIVSAGTLALGQVSPLPNTSGIFLADGTTLRPEVTNVFLGAPIVLSDSGGTATINAPTLNLGGGGGIVSPLTLGGPISGDGTVVFNGSANDNTYGTILLNAPSTYTGDTLLNTTSTGATLFLKLGCNNALPATTVLTIDGGNGAGSGRFTQLDLNGFDQTLAGLTNVPRTLRLQRIVNRSASYAVLTMDNAQDCTFSGQFGSANASTGGVNFGLTKRGFGIFSLASATAYTGDTTVEGGTLRLSQPTLDSQSAVTVAAGAVLQLDFAGTNHVASLLLADTNQPGGIY